MQAQYVGTTVRIANEFTDSGDLVDPTTVTFKLRAPGATTSVDFVYGVAPEVVRDSIGVYRFDYEPLVPGTFVYSWFGDGVSDAGDLGFFEVLAINLMTQRVPAYMSSADLDVRVGAAKVDELFGDLGTGVRDSTTVNTILIEAEDFAATRMIKSWNIEQVNQMAARDETFRGQVAWVALELATERRPEFLAEDGKGRYWMQYLRAKEHFDALAKSKIASPAEVAVGKNKQSGGSLSAAAQPPPAPRFTWAPDKNNPQGSGGF